MGPALRQLPPIGDVYLSGWAVAWLPDALIVAATIGYLLLWRRHAARNGEREWRPLLCWLAAMVGVVLAFNSSIGIYADTLFSVHMLQHLLLIMVVPPLLGWAEPWRLVPTGADGRTVADVLDESPVWRRLTSPLLSVPLYTAVVVLTHLTAFQQWALDHHGLRVLENVLYLVTGYLLFAELVSTRESPRRIPDLIRFVTLVAAMGADTLTGVALMLTQRPVAPGYAAAHPGWGPSAIDDQNLAGGLMWVVGDGLMMVLMIIVGVLWGLRTEDSGIGEWLESARRRAILGEDWNEAVGDPATIDVEQAALDAYNERLALLNRQTEQHRPPPG